MRRRVPAVLRRTQYGVEKNGQRVLLTLWFDQDSGNSAQVAAFPLFVNVTPRESSPTADGEQSERSPQMSQSHYGSDADQ